MASVTDAIPLRDLRRMAALEEGAGDLERKAMQMLAEAEDRRRRAEAIQDRYEDLVADRGLEACVQDAVRADTREWNRRNWRA
ncbi:MAG: hypothetical protein ACP5C4_09655 [Methanomicrobiales archaeon]